MPGQKPPRCNLAAHLLLTLQQARPVLDIQLGIRFTLILGRLHAECGRSLADSCYIRSSSLRPRSEAVRSTTLPTMRKSLK